MVLTLYKKDTSPPCRSVFMTIHALNISDVEFVNVHIPAREHLTEEFIKMNPQHTIPLLRDGDFFIWDSHAICGYLVSTYGKTDSLYPKDPKKRAVVDQRLHFDSGVLFNILRTTVVKDPKKRAVVDQRLHFDSRVLFNILRTTVVPILYGEDKDFKPENLAKFKEAYDFMEKFLTKTWLASDDLTIADICCVSTISSMNEILPIEAKGYPKLTAWLVKCSEQAFYKKWNAPNILLFREMIKNKLAEKQSK